MKRYYKDNGMNRVEFDTKTPPVLKCSQCTGNLVFNGEDFECDKGENPEGDGCSLIRTHPAKRSIDEHLPDCPCPACRSKHGAVKVRKSFTLDPVVIKMLQDHSRKSGISQAQIVEGAIKKYLS